MKIINIIKYWIIQRPTEFLDKFQTSTLIKDILEAFINYSRDHNLIS